MQRLISIAFLVMCYSFTGNAQEMLNNYERAEQLLPTHLKQKVQNTWVATHFIKGSDSFWFTLNTSDGYQYYLADYKHKKFAFNHQKMADKISEFTGEQSNKDSLALVGLTFNSDLKTITFKKDTILLSCNLVDYTIANQAKPITYSETELLSPDSLTLAFIRDNNIWLRNLKSNTEDQITFDGTSDKVYGGSISWYFTKNESANQNVEYEIDAEWSPDSKQLMVSRYNREHCKKLYMLQSLPEAGWRSQVYSYFRPIAGDTIVPTIKRYFINAETKVVTESDQPSLATFVDYGAFWSKTKKGIYNLRYARGWQKVDFVYTDASTGKSNVIYSESSDTYVDPALTQYELTKDEKTLFWLSEKSGWNQLYKIDVETGEQTQITKGEYVIRSIKYVDEKSKKIYFSANGKESGRDPYLVHLYVTDFKGKNVKLLTSEDAFHNVTLEPNSKFFIDNFSTVNLPNKTVVRDIKTGKILHLLATANVDYLDSLKWKSPERYVVKGRNGVSDIYGVIYRPSNFDPSKTYPVIDGTYSGPQTIRTPKTFARAAFNMDNSLAELGFIVVTVDGLGSAFRSKEFHHFSYKNLGDIGGPDHIAAIKQLAKKYPYMDTTRVGIYGHSAGGYDATRALIIYNNFYKVGVSGAGNHDHRVAKAWWPELYMGFPAGEEYNEQSNIVNASKLKGALMLAHGDLDNNVNAAGSLRMAAELTKENIDFELILIPNADHGQLWYNKYFVRKRWDFFVKNLMGAEPPHQYKIK